MFAVTSPLVGLSMFVSTTAAATWYASSRAPRLSTSSASRTLTSSHKSEDSTITRTVAKLPNFPLSLTYEEILARLFNYSTPRSRPRTHDELSAEFDIRQAFFNQQLQLIAPLAAPLKVIHVTGTKGKGSTCELVASALRGAGYSVGVFSSPHLHTACERIKINTDLISREEFSQLAVWAMECMASERWAVFFDVLLLMALRYFVDKKVDYVILEVGIGGRFDSTNYVISPAASVVTSVSLDHQGMLGDSIAAIAWQKAGIIKHGTPVFVPASLHPDALEVVKKECSLKQAPLHVVAMDSDEVEGDNCRTYAVEKENVSVSVAVCRHLGIPVDGMRNYYWPCRMETFDLADENSTASHDPIVVLDGSHNALSVSLCVRGLRERYPTGQGYDLWVAFGSGKDKNLGAMLEEVLRGSDNMIATVSKHFRALDAQGMVDHVPPHFQHKLLQPSEAAIHALSPTEGASLRSGGVAARLTWAINQARKRSQTNMGKKVVIVVCGSLFVAAEAREFLFSVFPSKFATSDWVRRKDDEVPMAPVPSPGSERRGVRKSRNSTTAGGTGVVVDTLNSKSK